MLVLGIEPESFARAASARTALYAPLRRADGVAKSRVNLIFHLYKSSTIGHKYLLHKVSSGESGEIEILDFKDSGPRGDSREVSPSFYQVIASDHVICRHMCTAVKEDFTQRTLRIILCCL